MRSALRRSRLELAKIIPSGLKATAMTVCEPVVKVHLLTDL
ncbi:MAG: hypothetical protein ACLBM1_01945 [Cuspidothrix sp.]